MKIASGTLIGNGTQRVAAFSETVDLQAHSLVLLQGPNGSGKTTLLKTLQGLVHYKNPQALTPLSHSLYLPERLDWAEELSFTAALHSLCALTFRDLFSTLARRLDLPPKTAYGILSKGNRQKMSVLLTEAIAHSRGSQWILLDEPLSGLDPAAQATLIDFWNRSSDQRRIISSHGDLSRFTSGLILHLEAGTIAPATATTYGTQDA